MAEEIKVLVVEDDDIDAEEVARAFKDAEGFTLERAASLAGAVGAYRSEGADIVVLDLGLADSPGGQGTVLDFMAACPGVPLVIVTGDQNESTRRDVLALGVQAFLVKGASTGREVFKAVAEAATALPDDLKRDLERARLRGQRILRACSEVPPGGSPGG